MIIIKFIGGLGNQLFQYALYNELEYNGHDVSADISDYANHNSHNGFEVTRCFDVKLRIPTVDELLLVKDVSPKIFSRIRRRLGFKKSTHVFQHELKDGLKLDRLSGEVYLEGYWQSMDGYENCIYRLKNSIKFIFDTLSRANQEVLNIISNRYAIGIHLRRGDYLSVSNVNAFEQCSESYYNSGINILLETNNTNKEVSYFVFSDDIAYARIFFERLESVFFVDWNHGDESYLDMYLMSQCQALITANSTFSWWAGILGVEKNVVAPKYWWKKGVTKNRIYLPDKWSVLDNRKLI